MPAVRVAGIFYTLLGVVDPVRRVDMGHIAQVGISSRASEGVSTAEIIGQGVTVHGVLGGVAYPDHAIGLIERGIVDPADLIDFVWPWQDICDAIRYAVRGGTARPKVLIDFTGITAPE